MQELLDLTSVLGSGLPIQSIERKEETLGRAQRARPGADTPPIPDMVDLVHRVKVFVYRYREGAPDYLLLRAAGHESFWGPIQGPIGFGEKLDNAIVREVMDDIGLARPMDLIDLHLPGRWVLGDEEIIEWSYGFRTMPEQNELQLSHRWAAFRWAQFNEAYPSLELDNDRATLLRLHSLLHDV